MLKTHQMVEILNNEIDQYIGRDSSVSPYVLKRPIIGITAHDTEYGSCIAKAYTQAIERAGGKPLLIPITDNLDVIFETLCTIDGLVLSGGDDIYPSYMDTTPHQHLGKVNPFRDKYELQIIHIAERLNLPILGICRGLQILGVAYGSSMYQDIPSEKEEAIGHNPPIPKDVPHHLVDIKQGSRLQKILQLREGQTYEINSIHHQALKQVVYPFEIVATAPDGIIEAIDAYPERDILAVQWHPEQLVMGNNEKSLLLFEHIVHRASLYQRARKFHKRYISIDSHTDTPMLFDNDCSLLDMPKAKVDITKMEIGDIDATIMVCYLPQGNLTEEAHHKAQQFTRDKLQAIQQKTLATHGRAVFATNVDDIIKAKQSCTKAIIPAIENGYGIGTDLSMLQELKEKYGIVYITLCHNGDNAICDSARRSEQTHHGLSEFGKSVVKEMNRLGIMVDISHTGEETVRDTLKESCKPIFASHSSVRAICNHPRNLWDDQIKAIAAKGGVVQICLYAGFINENTEKASLLDAIEHIEHIIKLVGIDFVGIGSDFDGDGELIGCRNSEDLIRITIELLDKGYNEEQLSKLWGGNFLRVMKIVQS